MSRYVFKMPDLGEGTVAAEVVAWHVKVGDKVADEQVIFEAMTEKATVEVSSPVSGRVVSIFAEAGQSVAVGAQVIEFEVESAEPASAVDLPKKALVGEQAAVQDIRHASHVSTQVSATAARVMASPATRRRAKESGVNLAQVRGSGPAGRVLPEDLKRHLSTDRTATEPSAPAAGSRASSPPGIGDAERVEIPVIGIRRLIAQRMSESARTIPHFSYVEEIDVTELEALRLHLNAQAGEGAESLTYLPFIALALVRVLAEFPQCNACYDSQREVVVRHRPLHLGVATQTPQGLKVPVVRHVETRSLAEVAAEIRRLSRAARDNTAKREELSGSTLTLTSLGRLGGVVTTPIINAPEVAIIGVNKAEDRVVARRGVAVVRRMMNLSSSFDHRFVDGHDAAGMIQALKAQLEHPATIFLTHTKGK